MKIWKSASINTNSKWKIYLNRLKSIHSAYMPWNSFLLNACISFEQHFLTQTECLFKKREKTCFWGGEFDKTCQLPCLSSNADLRSFMHLELWHFILYYQRHLWILIRTTECCYTFTEFEHVTALHSIQLCGIVGTLVSAIEKFKKHRARVLIKVEIHMFEKHFWIESAVLLR